MDHTDVPRVGDYMTPGPYSTGPGEEIVRADAFMREHGIRHLPIVDGGKLVGIVSDRDLRLVEAVVDEGGAGQTVGDAMTPDPFVVAPSDSLNYVARRMLDRRIGSAIVVDRGAVVGVFTASDGLRALVEALEGTAPRRAYEGVTTAPPEPRRHHDLR